MHSPAYDMFYRNALMGLMNGCLMPWDKDILSDTPLPSSVIEPYMAKEVPDVRESMRLTYETMAVWIDEARKVNYFSKRFVQLSRMIMTGVTTMGRGLVTLHARDEALEGVPMSIQDLIGVASYHFRKSHLGVLQTVRSHPEVSERLLMNQIGWNNMLMRLFKTRDKLNQKPDSRNQIGTVAEDSDLSRRGLSHDSEKSGIRNSEIGNQKLEAAGMVEAGSSNSGSLPCGEKQLLPGGAAGEAFDPFKIFAPADRGFSAPAAISEPGAFTAPRAFRSYENQSKIRNHIGAGTGDLDLSRRGLPQDPGKSGNRAEIGNQKSGENQKECGKREAESAVTENGLKIEEDRMNRKSVTGNKEEQMTGKSATGNKEEFQNAENDRDPEDGKNQKENRYGIDSETESGPPTEPSDNYGDGPIKGKSQEGDPPDKHGDGFMKEKSPEGDPPDNHGNGFMKGQSPEGDPPDSHGDGPMKGQSPEGEPSDNHGAAAHNHIEKPSEKSASQGRGISVSCLRK
ncbi:MAG: hypothetical protein IJI14_05090 [Anaerolineaceae bacterium]|nr:hypothetical protein [Anaerolineaceae bacterium]